MITFYDSGIGGLTIAKEYQKLNPKENFRYYADFNILPMGDKTRVKILDQIKGISSAVFKIGNLLVLGCNTASVNTIRELQHNWLPVFFPQKQILSISKPITELLEQQYSSLKNQKLVILATQATIDSGFYQKEFEQIGFTNTLAVACPGLSDLIENCIFKDWIDLPFERRSHFLDYNSIKELITKIENAKIENPKIESYLKNLNLPSYSLILLACTHYPIIKGNIKALYPSCTIIDPSNFIAMRLIKYEKNHPEY
jgi:glutamate racemase